MTRKVFFSFHFSEDFWRTQQVRNMNALEGNPLATPNAWEEVKGRGDDAVKRWISDEMDGRTCAVVLVGAKTAERKWVKYEIEKAWNDGRGVLGIHINKLLGIDGNPSTAGANPFDSFTLSKGTKKLSSVVPLKNPAGTDSKAVYATIATYIERWIEEAIKARKDFRPHPTERVSYSRNTRRRLFAKLKIKAMGRPYAIGAQPPRQVAALA